MTWGWWGKRVRAAKVGVQTLVVVRRHFQWKASHYEEFVEEVVDPYVAFGGRLDEDTAVVLRRGVGRRLVCRNGPAEQRT